MKFIIDREKYIDTGLIDERFHTEFPLVLYNYSQKCQFSKTWDEVTKMCRGLIVHKDTREIIARPFSKFFNYEEHVEKGDVFPNETPNVYTKFDGSLGILYWWDNEPYIATRGSFVSDQAKWATNYINIPDVYSWVEKLDKKHTHLFEIIYPENRIVVAYDRAELVHLASIDIETGKSCEPDSCFPMTSKIPFTSFAELKSLNIANEEGFVIHYPNADFRMKIKFEDYVKLHKVMTGLSEIGIWEMLKDEKDILQIIGDTPDEMHDWIKGVVGKLLTEFVNIETQATIVENETLNIASRKDKAIIVSKSPYASIVFSMIDNKDYKQAIWKLIRPRGSIAFRKDFDK